LNAFSFGCKNGDRATQITQAGRPGAQADDVRIVSCACGSRFHLFFRIFSMPFHVFSMQVGGNYLRRSAMPTLCLDDLPHVFRGVAEFAAGDACRETIIADGDLLVDVLICEVIGPLCHGAYEDTNALVWLQLLHVMPNLDQLRIKTQRDLSAVRR
jgi:hypothetical protein